MSQKKVPPSVKAFLLAEKGNIVGNGEPTLVGWRRVAGCTLIIYDCPPISMHGDRESEVVYRRWHLHTPAGSYGGILGITEDWK